MYGLLSIILRKRWHLFTVSILLIETLNQQTVCAIVVNNRLIIVLYSPSTRLWKIADFGLTSDAVTGEPVTTERGRGTSGYRPPELLAKDAKYTYKVDIWALGCILYELSIKKRAFVDDWMVQTRCSSSP